MDAEEILNLPKLHRKTFLWLICTFLVILIFVDLFILPMLPVAAKNFLSGYLHAVSGSIFVALFVLWIVSSFMPRSTAGGGLQELQPKEITAEFDNLLANTYRWRYKGNFGRYLRGTVLPTLSGRSNVHVSVCIIDPTDLDLCEKHAQYRRSINAIDKGRSYDADVVALEVVTTIIICSWYVANGTMAIEMYLSKVFDPVRIDSNDEAMILTVEDRRSSALKLASGHFMYEHFDNQMKYAREQSRKIELIGIPPGLPAIASLTEQHVSDFMDSADMGDLCHRIGARKILEACVNAKNPYAD